MDPQEASTGYRATQADDGTWTIRDVPIFAEHTDDRNDEPVEFSSKWLKRALDRAKIREAEGYLPPLHVAHHGSPEGVQAAGKFRITRMAPISHGGKQVVALYADLVGVRPEVYDRIRRGELSYRSVEILDVDSPEIDSLALLDHEVPYFRFPLLRVREGAQRSSTPVLAYSATGRARSVLVQFAEEADMPEDKKPEETMAADPAEALDAMLKMLGKIAEKLGVDEADEDEDSPEEPPVQDAAATPVEVSLPAVDHEAAGAQVAMAARLEALEQKLADSERQRRVDAHAGKLGARGYNADAVREFRSIADQHGEQAALSFARGLDQLGPSEPPRSWAGELRTEEPDPAEVSTYAAQGPEQLEKARSLHQSWQRTTPGVGLGEYLTINMDPDAFMTAARTNGGI
jgi:hypothetical protein